VAAEPAVEVVGVCEALKDLTSYSGKPLAVLGRFSFRASSGRFLSEESCGHQVKVAFDAQSAPKPPQPMVMDEKAVVEKLKLIKASTKLRQFRFGSEDYDRWAIVYGRLDPVKSKPGADLVCRGEGVILFLDDTRY